MIELPYTQCECKVLYQKSNILLWVHFKVKKAIWQKDLSHDKNEASPVPKAVYTFLFDVKTWTQWIPVVWQGILYPFYIICNNCIFSRLKFVDQTRFCMSFITSVIF